MSETDPALPTTDDVAVRSFTVEGRVWIARLAGEALAGSGHLGLAPLVLLRFQAEGDESASLETIIPAGRFPDLFDSELAALLAGARPLRD